MTSTKLPLEQTYGFIMNPPDAKKGDQCKLQKNWRRCIAHVEGYGNDCSKNPDIIRRRPINPGEGFEIVGLDEVIEAGHYDYTSNGTDFITWGTVAAITPRRLLGMSAALILAIRRPVVKEKVETVMKEPTDKWIAFAERKPGLGQTILIGYGNKVHPVIYTITEHDSFLPVYTHWISHPIPEPPKKEDGFEKALREYQKRSMNYHQNEGFREGWHAAKAEREDKK